MLLAAGEYGFDSKAEAGWNGVLAWALHVLCARTAREGFAMSESGSIADLSQHTVMLYGMLREVRFASPVVMYVCMHVGCSLAQHVGTEHSMHGLAWGERMGCH